MKNFNPRGRNDKRSFSGRDSGPRTMYRATCDECGESCEVPFKPTGSKLVYCSNCFEKNKGSDDRRSSGRDFGGRKDFGGRRDSGRPSFGSGQKFTAICDKCGESCEVPFKPTSGKPIFCNDCFGKKRDEGGKSAGPSKEQFEIINSKLDKILKALGLANSVVAEKKQPVKPVVEPKLDKKMLIVKPKNIKELKDNKPVAPIKKKKVAVKTKKAKVVKKSVKAKVKK